MIPQGGVLPAGEPVESIQQPSRTYRIDWENKRMVGMVDGLEAVKQAVIKIMRTERFRHLIYSSGYGFESDLIGRDPVFIQSELRRRITEALTQDDRVDSVTDFQIDVAGDTATVRFTVVSTFGSFQEEVTTRV